MATRQLRARCEVCCAQMRSSIELGPRGGTGDAADEQTCMTRLSLQVLEDPENSCSSRQGGPTTSVAAPGSQCGRSSLPQFLVLLQIQQLAVVSQMAFLSNSLRVFKLQANSGRLLLAMAHQSPRFQASCLHELLVGHRCPLECAQPLWA